MQNSEIRLVRNWVAEYLKKHAPDYKETGVVEESVIHHYELIQMEDPKNTISDKRMEVEYLVRSYLMLK